MSTIYEVQDGSGKSRLVEATNIGQCALHVLKPEIAIIVPTRQRLVELMKSGVVPEDATKKSSATTQTATPAV